MSAPKRIHAVSASRDPEDFKTPGLAYVSLNDSHASVKPKSDIVYPKSAPYGDRVLVWEDDKGVTTKSGIFLTENTIDNTQSGTVVAKGFGYYNETTGAVMPIAVDLGQRISFKKGTGIERVLDGNTYLLVSSRDIELILS